MGPGTDRHHRRHGCGLGTSILLVSTNASGDWWQIEYEGRLAWVYGGYVTPSVDAEDALQADPAGLADA